MDLPSEETIPSNNGALIADAPVKAEKKEDQVEYFDVEENLVFDLTDEELLTLAKSTSRLSSLKRTKENELKNIVDDKKSEIKGLTADIQFNMKLIEVGKQGREVECTKRVNYTRGIVEFLFAGKVMKSRGIEHNEKARPQDNTTSSVNQ